MYTNTAQRVPIPPQEREKMRQYGTNFLTRAFGHTRIVNRLPECIERLEMDAYNKCIDQKTYYNYFQKKLDSARDTILKNHRSQPAAAAHQQGPQQQPSQHVQQPGYAPTGATHALQQQQQQQQPPPQGPRFDANGVMVPNGGLGAEQGSEQTDDQFADFLGAFVNNNNGGAQQLQQQQQQQQQQLMGQTMYGQQPQQAVPYQQAGVMQQQQQQPVAGNGMPRPQPALAASAGAVAQMQQQLAGKVPGVPQAGTPGMQMGPMPGAYQQPIGAGPMGIAVAPRAPGTAPPFSQPPPNGAVLGPHGVAGAGGGSGPSAVIGGGPGTLVVDQSMAGMYGTQMGIQPGSAVPHGAGGMMAMPGQQLPGMMTGIAPGHQQGPVGVTGGGGAGAGMGLMPPQQAVHPQQPHPHSGVPAPAAQTQYGVQPSSQQDLQKHVQYVQAMQQQHMQAQHQAAAAAAAAAVVAVQQQQQQQQAAVAAAQQQQQQHQAAAVAAQMARLASGGVAGPPPPQQSQQQQANAVAARGGAAIRPVGPAATCMPTGGMPGAGMLAGVQQPSQNQHPQQQQVVAGGAPTVVAPYAAAAATAAGALVPQQPVNGVTAPTALAAATAALQVPKAAVGVAATAAPPPAGAANNVANPHNIGIAQGGNTAAPAVGANAEAPNIAGDGARQDIRQEYWGLVNQIKARMPALTTCLERSNRLHEHQASDPKAARTRQCLQEAYRRCTIDPSSPEYANLPIHPNINKVLNAVLHYLTGGGSGRRNHQVQPPSATTNRNPQARQPQPTQPTQQHHQPQQQQIEQQQSQQLQQQQTAPSEAPIGAVQTHGTATAARPAALTPPQHQQQQQTQQQKQHFANGGNAAAAAGAAGGGIASVPVKQEPVKQEPVGVADGTSQNAAATAASTAAVNQANRMAAVAAVQAAAHNSKLRAAKPPQTTNTHRQPVGKTPAELAAAHGRLTADAALTSKMERTADSLPAGVDQVTRLLGLLGQQLPPTVLQVYSSRGAVNLLNFDGDSLMPSLPPAACAQLTAAAAAIAATGPPRARTVSVCRVAGMSYGTSSPASVAGGTADARDGAADGGVRRGLSVKGAAANGVSLEKVAGGKRKRRHEGELEGAAGLGAAALLEVKRRRQALEAACQEAEEELGGTVTLRLVEADAAQLSAAEAGVESEAWLLECAASISSAAADQAAGGTGGPPWKRMRVSVPWGYPDTPPVPTFSSTDPAYTHPYGRAARLHFQTALQAGQVPPQPSLQLLAKTWRDAVARVCNAVRVAETGGGATAMTAVY